ncbi:Fe-S cluster assembly protein SufB [Olsenella sp. HMSC062G07]|uniref:Fe-S cluster assembly protein SufB n=1 Tax=Olsenella sp. HMSC062G07 TaxID=1739330 RepID=UPI0008A54DA9|nr:Fe-S cluster assembly protein SufB [Olsenella sp. HMSC062G07]OFK24818.1 Fe-S cluster assembly protein SufB [Olsenella sp. HMSC062G07]
MSDVTPPTLDERGRSKVADVDRSLYDFKMSEEGYERYADGLTPDIVRAISRKKGEPAWMLELRLKALDVYHRRDMAPNWGPDISGLDLDHISTYVSAGAAQARDWDDVPTDIKDTFERLGIPEAERKSLAGVGAQYDSEIVYHNMREEVAKNGVVYTTIEDALRDPQWEGVVRAYFGKLIPMDDHKFAALHYAVWSGGSFVFVPAGVRVDYPLQSYFRLNASGAGQFEHTLIIVEEGADLHFIEGCSAPKYYEANLHAGAVELYVKDGARLRYSTIENWSKNMYNLNTKRATVGADAKMEWVSGSFGSHVSYLYPTTILAGANSTCEFTGITFAGAGQDLDTGCKVVLGGANTAASVDTKSISKDGGVNTFRSAVVVGRKADHARASVSCQSLMLDDISRSDTIPAMDVRNNTASVGHEASIGRISNDTILYLMSRGCSEQEARSMVVNGFANPVSKELPLEYAVEMNNLIKLEMEGAIG